VKKFIEILAFAVILSVALGMAGCGDDEAVPRIEVEMENGGIFIIELYPEHAPATVENFVKLVEEGFYDGLTFHRIVDGFMAQGGCSLGNGTGGSGENIFGEFASNGFRQNMLRHTTGVISMARSTLPNSASSQFFIMLGDNAGLDGDYAAFGKVIEGFEVVEALQTVERITINPMDGPASPVEPVIIKKMTAVYN